MSGIAGRPGEDDTLGDGALDDGAFDEEADELIAVVGMAGRFPEAPDLDAFWHNLRTGRDCLHTFTDAELDELGIPARYYQQDNFVRRGTTLPHRDEFDARFFGFTPKQAAIMDPQARIFLETCYEALESAGYNPYDTGNTVGVFTGSNPNDYALLLGVADPTDSLTAFDQLIGVDRDFVATRVSHNLGLTGPAMTLQTACSTSLVTIHAAVQSLLAYECSMALAGGVSINLRQGIGYFYQQGMILSPVGECRAFDAEAEGTTLGQGCGVVALRRLADAEADNDTILAIVRATAINNDGSAKISYTAPSEDGQAAVIATAHGLAGIESDSIDYVETHGTGTLLGDPIEIAALTRAFRPGTDRTQFCGVGSAKTSVGHTDAAAGVTGFIKTVLALQHRELPPSLHFDEPNPAIDFAASPFYVNAELRPWPETDTPRRAGVSAFGIGGTNAHAVLEEAPPATPSAEPERPQILVVSGRTASAADQRLADLGAGAGAHPLGDVAHTLVVGRPAFDHRRAIVVAPGPTGAHPIEATIAGETGSRPVRGTVPAGGQSPDVVWLFAGQGAQYPSMGRGLYEREPVFAAAVDRVAAVVDPLLGLDLRQTMFAEPTEAAADTLRQTAITQPALFAIEHALACLLRSWGQTPAAVVGHSIGEYAAAVEAGILAWDDAARLVVERGRLMQSMAPGSMLAVPLAADDLTSRLPDGVELAAANSTELSVVSGPTPAVEAWAAELEASGVKAQLLHTSHAFHSAMMNEAVDAFAVTVATVALQAPTVPMLANVTGRLLTAGEATDPGFWAGQIRQPVLFGACLDAAVEALQPAGSGAGPVAFLELGPGRALSTFVNASATAESVVATPTMRHPQQERPDQMVALEALARLWTVGVELDWEAVNGSGEARRVPLPTYPFEREEAWLPPYRHVLALPHFGPQTEGQAAPTEREPLDRWLYAPSWRREPTPDPRPAPAGTTILLAPWGPGGDALVAELGGIPTAGGDEARLLVVRPGPGPTVDGAGPALPPPAGIEQIVVDPSTDDGLAEALAALAEEDTVVPRLIHAWLADPGALSEPDPSAEPGADAAQESGLDGLESALDLGLHSLLAAIRGLSPLRRQHPVQVDVVAAGAFSVIGHETVRPEASALRGPVTVAPLEYTGLSTRLIDVPLGLTDPADRRAVIGELGHLPAPAGDDGRGGDDLVVALRHGQRWVPTVAVRPTTEVAQSPVSRLRHQGRYLIVGGLGGVGLSIAHHLATTHQASLILTSRRGRPGFDHDTDDDTAPETRRRAELLDEIEAAATALHVAAVDAGDEAAMAQLITDIEAEGGPLNGVIVAAGVADQMGAIHRRTRADMTASVASKIHGSLVLDRALGNRQLDFVLLSSSIASVLYHNRFAQVGYVTGNSYVEAFAHRSRQRGRPTTTVAWDDWLDIGMSVRAAQEFSAEFGTAVDLVDQLHSFSPADGVRLFERALATDEPVLLVSTTDLERRIATDVDVVSPFLEQATSDDGEIELDPAAGTTTDLVTAVWSALLGFDTFDPNDDFFELGGDSLQAARMADRLTRSLGVEVAVDVIFDAPVLSALVEALDELGAAGTAPAASERSLDPVVLSPGQLRFLDRQSESPDHFNTSVLLRPRRPVTEPALRAAIDELVAQHEALRLRLLPPGRELDGPDGVLAVRQQSLPAPDLPHPLSVVDLRDQTTEVAVTALSAAATDLQRSMNLVAGPIFGAVLFLLPEGEQRILVVVHHLMCDRVSLLLMIDSLDASLAAAGSRSAPALGESAPASTSARSATSVLDWVEALVEAGTEPEAEAYVARLADRPWDRVRPVPVDHGADLAENRNETVGVVVTPVPAADLDLGAATDARPDELFLLALMKALAAWSGADAALVDLLGHGRRLPVDVDVSRSVGMFLNYSPVLLDLTGDPDLATLVAQVRSELAESWRLDPIRCYGDAAVGGAVRSLPRAEVLYNFVGRAIATDDQALLVAATEDRGPESDPGGRRDHPLAVKAELVDDDTFELTFVYSRALHDTTTIEHLAKLTSTALAELTAER